MTRTTSPGWVAAIGLALVPVTVTPARADFFPLFHHEKKSCFDKSCGTTRVVIPQRQVEVVNERPQVIIREAAPTREVVTRTVKHQRAAVAAPLAIGTVYMPVALPAIAGVREVHTEALPNPLESFHRAELAQYHAQLHADRAQAELNATLAAQKRVAARFGSPLSGSGGCDSDVKTRLDKLSDQLNQMNDRVTAVEKLLIIHDNIIKDKVLPGTGRIAPQGVTVPPVAEPTKPPLPMIPPIPSGQ